jgi:hypothetical protein
LAAFPGIFASLNVDWSKGKRMTKIRRSWKPDSAKVI